MIWTVSRYLSRLFLMRFAFLMLGLALLVVFLDFLADGDQVLEAGGGAVLPILRYTVLRLPEIVSELIPITAMLAGFLTFAGLARFRELTALQGVGLSKFALAAAIAPAAVLIGAMQFVIEDQALPAAVGELRAWGVADYAAADGQTTWIRQGTDIVRIGRFDRAADRLENLTIFRRDGAGNLLERIEAKTAVYRDGRWSLQSVRRSAPGEPAEIEAEPLGWPQGMSLDLLLSAAAHPKETPFLRLLEISSRSDLGTQPSYRYRLWLHKRLAGPVTTMILIMLTVALAQPFETRTGRGILLAIWLGAGFVAWTFDGLVLTFGEIGLLPPVLAAWTPPLVFAAVAAWLMLHDERRKVRHAPRVPAFG
ncbi:MAG TPA: LptF/LptG family permease [Geminicoccaceae bacterium]|nr:LptF/LptG family permease [Geminicoccaceae bacterium]